MCNPSTLTSLIQCVTSFFQLAVPVLVALALLYFFWGIASFILKADDQEELKKGRARMLWGIVALFLILSIAGLIGVIQQTFFGASTTSDGAVAPRNTSGIHTLPQGVPANSFPSGSGGAALDGDTSGLHSGAANREPGFFRGIWNQLGF